MSEKSLSLEQAAYLAARANYEAVNAAYEEGEAAFLREAGARAASGEVPAKLYMIDDLEQFERLSAAFERSPRYLADDLTTAAALLQSAEEALIQYAIDICPASIRDTIRQGATKSADVRKKLLSLILRLDPSTLRRPAI